MEKKKKSWARGEIASKKIFFGWGNCHRHHPREDRDGDDFGFLYLVPPPLFFSASCQQQQEKGNTGKGVVEGQTTSNKEK